MENGRLTETTEAELQRSRDEIDDLRASLRRSDAERGRLEVECARLVDEAEALRARTESMKVEHSSELARTGQPTAGPPSPGVAAGKGTSARRLLGLTRKLGRKMHPPVWRVVGPLARRTRAFMNAPLLDALSALPSSQPITPPPQDTSALRREDLDQFAQSVERALLTLTLGAARPTRKPLDASVENGFIAAAAIDLPYERRARIMYYSDDISVGGSIAATSDWEPHVRRHLERVVKPDSTCLDIGANIGAHTLSLATLAYMGRVIGFEADPNNRALLARNVAALGGAIADVEVAGVALWNQVDRLTLASSSALSGHSFVSSDPLSRADGEKQLRRTVTSAELVDLDLQIREIEAVPLDTWTADRALQRIDLIKLDVGGAETRILAGAVETLRRDQPTLIVEYNPTYAEQYFDEAPITLYNMLFKQFDIMEIIEDDGTTTPVTGWEALKVRFEDGKGWENLSCRFE